MNYGNDVKTYESRSKNENFSIKLLINRASHQEYKVELQMDFVTKKSYLVELPDKVRFHCYQKRFYKQQDWTLIVIF